MIADQPPPVATDRRATWDIVVEHVEKQIGLAELPDTDAVRLLIADMRERDRVGHARYGVRLTSGNGRDHLVDALQEILDAVVYLANELEEQSVGLGAYLDGLGGATGRHLRGVQQLLASQIHAAIELRGLIEERAS